MYRFSALSFHTKYVGHNFTISRRITGRKGFMARSICSPSEWNAGTAKHELSYFTDSKYHKKLSLVFENQVRVETKIHMTKNTGKKVP